MTERKPADMDFETWIDRQIRTATERGEFDDLAGSGKPLTGLGAGYDELWWVKQLMQREGLSYLPPALRLRKDVQDTLEAVDRARTEPQVRTLIADLNERIITALKQPVAEGPPVNVAPLDVQDVLGDWRGRRAAQESQGTNDGAAAGEQEAHGAGRPRSGRWRRLIWNRRD